MYRINRNDHQSFNLGLYIDIGGKMRDYIKIIINVNLLNT